LDSNMERIYEDYIVIKAEENGVNIIGLTRGKIRSSTIPRNWIRVKFLLPSLPIILLR